MENGHIVQSLAPALKTALDALALVTLGHLVYAQLKGVNYRKASAEQGSQSESHSHRSVSPCSSLSALTPGSNSLEESPPFHIDLAQFICSLCSYSQQANLSRFQQEGHSPKGGLQKMLLIVLAPFRLLHARQQ